MTPQDEQDIRDAGRGALLGDHEEVVMFIDPDTEARADALEDQWRTLRAIAKRDPLWARHEDGDR